MSYSLEEVNKKKKEYDDAARATPGEFSSVYDDLRVQMLDKIASREDFSYDPSTDEVYNIYKESYQKQGQKAMKDTLASASALTGGYANSYAARASADAYNDYLSRSGEILPDLYELALERYNRNAKNEDALYALYNGLYEGELESYNDLWDRYYKNLSEKESAYKTAKSAYDSDRKYYSSKSSSSKSSSSNDSAAKSAKTETAGIKAFNANILSKTEYSRSVLRRYYPSYTAYVRNTAVTWRNNGQMTADEYAYIQNMYGF